MNRSYRVIIHGNTSHSFVMANSAKEAGEIAAKLAHEGEKFSIEDTEHKTISEEELAAIIRAGDAA